LLCDELNQAIRGNEQELKPVLDQCGWDAVLFVACTIQYLF
jgi:hypothetical protein